MKVLVNIVVLLFLTFLSAPTIVSLLADEDTKVSMAYSLNEEEIHKEIKEVVMHSQWVCVPAFIPVIKKSAKIHSKYLLKHESISGDIFIPPPDCC